MLGAPRRVLAVIPHPDDESAGCGGCLALAARAGIQIVLVLVTDGEASHRSSRSHPPARLKQVRRAELRGALRRLGVAARPIRLGLPDGDCEQLTDEGLAPARRRLARTIRRTRPDLVLTPWRRDPHGDHRAASRIAREASAATATRLVEYDVWTRLTGGPNDQPRGGEAAPVDLDVSPVRRLKRLALERHRSQLGRLVGDDPDGFALSRRERRALTGGHERYYL